MIQTYYYMKKNRVPITFKTSGAISDFFAEKTHAYHHDFESEVLMDFFNNRRQNHVFKPIIGKIKGISKFPALQAKAAISIVQHIPYDWERLIDGDWKYPYETLHQNKGICADKSILAGYFLKKLGYDVVLFEWKNKHMAVGIKCNQKYVFKNTEYAFIEVTRPTIITFVPDRFISGFVPSSKPNLYYLNKGGKALNVSHEFLDSNELKNIQKKGSPLNLHDYNKWSTISQKYDLLWDI